MKRWLKLCGVLFIGLLASRALAEDICPQLSKLITDPPAGFISDRAEPVSPQRWASKPFLSNAKCVVWASRATEAHNIRCAINDGSTHSIVANFYRETEQAIDRCLAALPDGNKYDRQTSSVATAGLKGAETRWIYDSDIRRFQIDLTDYTRINDGSFYNSFSVEYLKY